MTTFSVIREDLKDIRYYYMRKADFDDAFEKTGENKIVEKVKLYNHIIQNASPKLYDLYVSLYINCHTQESLSDKLGFTPEYIQMLNKKLLKFLQENLNKGEYENEPKKDLWTRMQLLQNKMFYS